MNENTILSEKKIKKYLRCAKKVSLLSDNKKTRVGCVVVYKNKIISVGHNYENKTNPLQKKYNELRGYNPNDSISRNTLHAEIDALLSIEQNVENYNKIHLFIVRSKRDESNGIARPCPACMGLIKKMGIKNIYYSTENGPGSWCYEKIKE